MSGRVSAGTLWMTSFGGGVVTWFAVICFARVLPPPLQFLSMLCPIASFGYSLWVIPKWQQEGKYRDLAEAVGDRRLQRQFQLDLQGVDSEFDAIEREMEAMYTTTPSDTPSNTPTLQLMPYVRLSLPAKVNQSSTLQEHSKEVAGENGAKLVAYLTGKGGQYCDADGWISVEKLRVNWSRNNKLAKKDLLELLSTLTYHQIGEWRSSECVEWRLLAS